MNRRITIIVFVILVLAAISALCIYFYIRQQSNGLIDGRKIWMHNVQQALDAYHIRHGAFPSTGEGLKALETKRIMKEMPKDGWVNEFSYVRHDKDSYTLKSLGADGKPGGSGDDEDIVINGLFRRGRRSGDVKRFKYFMNTVNEEERKKIVFLMKELKLFRDKGEKDKAIRSIISLSNKHDMEFLSECMKYRDLLQGVRDVIMAYGQDGMNWFIMEYKSNESQIKKAGMVYIMSWLRYKELYRILARELDNGTEVRDVDAASTAPGSYKHKRICDFAYNTLFFRLRVDKKKIEDDEDKEIIASMGNISPLHEIEMRNTLIDKMKVLIERKVVKEIYETMPSIKNGK